MTKGIRRPKLISLLMILLFFLIFQSVTAQPTAQKLKKKPYDWIISCGYVTINDSEEKLSNLFDIQGSWNFAPYPNYFSLNKFSKRGKSHEFFFTFSPYNYSLGNNDTINTSGYLASANYNYKFSFNQFLKISKDLDPFIAFGAGYSYRSAIGKSTFVSANITLGTNYWFSKHWGLQVQGIAKIALLPESHISKSDCIQLTGGLTYRSFPKKRSKRPKKQYEWTRERNNYKRKNTR